MKKIFSIIFFVTALLLVIFIGVPLLLTLFGAANPFEYIRQKEFNKKSEISNLYAPPGYSVQKNGEHRISSFDGDIYIYEMSSLQGAIEITKSKTRTDECQGIIKKISGKDTCYTNLQNTRFIRWDLNGNSYELKTTNMKLSDDEIEKIINSF